MRTSPALFSPSEETISSDALRSLQLQKLRHSVRYAAEKSPLYKDKKRLVPADAAFSSLEDFSSLPFTTKANLLTDDVFENLCVPRGEIAEVHFSSGTSNKPVPSFLTAKDLKESSTYLARTWHMQGVRADSIFTMFASYGLFSAGFLNHYALQRIGAFIIPAGNASAMKTLELLKGFESDTCAAVASYYLYLVAMAETNGFDLKSLALKHMVAGGEPFSEKQRGFIEQAFGAQLYDQYGLCEINTGIAGECAEKDGLHILADYVYPEIIDPETGGPLPEGAEGELVLTTFHKEASPLIRYRTGDITSITYAPCRCGRTMPRIARVKRRAVDTLFYKGIKIEKPFIAQTLEELSERINPYMWQMEINTAAGRDELVLKIALVHEGDDTVGHVTGHLEKKLGVRVKVAPFGSDELSRFSTGKLKHFIDNRST
jgi:phenylacetate-CoA ligase